MREACTSTSTSTSKFDFDAQHQQKPKQKQQHSQQTHAQILLSDEIFIHLLRCVFLFTVHSSFVAFDAHVLHRDLCDVLFVFLLLFVCRCLLLKLKIKVDPFSYPCWELNMKYLATVNQSKPNQTSQQCNEATTEIIEAPKSLKETARASDKKEKENRFVSSI